MTEKMKKKIEYCKD
jgi:chromosome segregation ATPase